MRLFALFKLSTGSWDYFSFNGESIENGFVIFATEEQVLDLLKKLNKNLSKLDFSLV